MKKFTTYLSATLLYWILFFLGPALVMLLNNIGYYVSGSGWGPESLMYKVLLFFSQPLACFFAYTITAEFLKGRSRLLLSANCILGTILCFVLVCTSEQALNRWAMVASVASSAGTAAIPMVEIFTLPSEKKAAEIVKKVYFCTLITVILWVISRFIPALIYAVFPEQIPVFAVSLIALLPVGWVAACAISKNRYSFCIRLNLYLFALIELVGISVTVFYLYQNLAHFDRRYTSDLWGIAYADYPVIFGGLLLAEVTYVILCFYLAKKSSAVS